MVRRLLSSKRLFLEDHVKKKEVVPPTAQPLISLYYYFLIQNDAITLRYPRFRMKGEGGHLHCRSQ